MEVFGNLFLATFVTIILLGGPLTAFIIIKVLNSLYGDIKVRFVPPSSVPATEGTPNDSSLGLLVAWDDRSFDYAINRVKLEYVERVPGGRSTAFSFTFEDKRAQKKSFVIPMKIAASDAGMLTDTGISVNPKAVDKSYLIMEVEKVNGDVIRKKITKKEILKELQQNQTLPADGLNVLPPTQPDSWSVFTRVFPWRKVVAEAGEAKPKVKKDPNAAPQVFDFLITKVWIEPGCIVCDACENEAPDVFEVLADTCIVRPNYPMSNVGSIVAAAEGCPVDVIKYDKAPKSA